LKQSDVSKVCTASIIRATETSVYYTDYNEKLKTLLATQIVNLAGGLKMDL
jgi:hypothetical protein